MPRSVGHAAALRGCCHPASRPARRLLSSTTICRVIDTVIGRHMGNVEGIDALQATYVETVLLRVRTALMVRVDPAVATEIVLRSHGIELIDLQNLPTFDNSYGRQGNGSDYCTLSSADRTVAPSRINDTV